MTIYVAILAFQVFCIVDVIRRGRSTIWIMALVFLPLASGIAYFIVEILPTLQHNRVVNVSPYGNGDHFRNAHEWSVSS